VRAQELRRGEKGWCTGNEERKLHWEVRMTYILGKMEMAKVTYILGLREYYLNDFM
jgi:hypothetical protein